MSTSYALADVRDADDKGNTFLLWPSAYVEIEPFLFMIMMELNHFI